MTNLAYDLLRKKKRWQPDAQDKAKALVITADRKNFMLCDLN